MVYNFYFLFSSSKESVIITQQPPLASIIMTLILVQSLNNDDADSAEIKSFLIRLSIDLLLFLIFSLDACFNSMSFFYIFLCL